MPRLDRSRARVLPRSVRRPVSHAEGAARIWRRFQLGGANYDSQGTFGPGSRTYIHTITLRHHSDNDETSKAEPRDGWLPHFQASDRGNFPKLCRRSQFAVLYSRSRSHHDGRYVFERHEAGRGRISPAWSALRSALRSRLGHVFAGSSVAEVGFEFGDHRQGLQEEIAERIVPVVDPAAEPETHLAFTQSNHRSNRQSSSGATKLNPHRSG